MFNIGPGELMAILAVALIVLGPTRLPQAVRTMGRVVGELRRISSGFQDELRNAFDDDDVIDQLEKGPSATPTRSKGGVADTPVVDTTGTLSDDAAGKDPDGARKDPDTNGADTDDAVDTGTETDAVDTAALGLSTTVPTEPVAGAEDSGEPRVGDEIDDDPPETDQRAAS